MESEAPSLPKAEETEGKSRRELAATLGTGLTLPLALGAAILGAGEHRENESAAAEVRAGAFADAALPVAVDDFQAQDDREAIASMGAGQALDEAVFLSTLKDGPGAVPEWLSNDLQTLYDVAHSEAGKAAAKVPTLEAHANGQTLEERLLHVKDDPYGNTFETPRKQLADARAEVADWNAVKAVVLATVDGGGSAAKTRADIAGKVPEWERAISSHGAAGNRDQLLVTVHQIQEGLHRLEATGIDSKSGGTAQLKEAIAEELGANLDFTDRHPALNAVLGGPDNDALASLYQEARASADAERASHGGGVPSTTELRETLQGLLEKAAGLDRAS